MINLHVLKLPRLISGFLFQTTAVRIQHLSKPADRLETSLFTFPSRCQPPQAQPRQSSFLSSAIRPSMYRPRILKVRNSWRLRLESAYSSNGTTLYKVTICFNDHDASSLRNFPPLRPRQIRNGLALLTERRIRQLEEHVMEWFMMSTLGRMNSCIQDLEWARYQQSSQRYRSWTEPE
jgi:hypothetical protein